ncbi:aldo/keto reductase [Pseudactinotalea sp. Z1748]|uniref:aldo/keto reductase n=1 Tax=Pseudactinotalea sp. Z1748 TaxID=3413027 RepID=UPI003C79E066
MRSSNPLHEPAAHLPDGVQMPMLGFGTWQISGEQCRRAVATALGAGYRHLDTAAMYRNEAEVGQALVDSGLPREDVFITTKLLPADAARAREALEDSLAVLNVPSVDLYLIHSPPDEGGPGIWEQLLAAREEGLARAVGVSNYSIDEVDELIEATGVAPAVKQVRWAPSVHDPVFLAESAERGVVVEGYSPFRSSDLEDQTLGAIADAHDVTPAQVVLRWHLHHDIVVIPKSVTPQRIRANADLFGFSLTADEVARIDALAG